MGLNCYLFLDYSSKQMWPMGIWFSILGDTLAKQINQYASQDKLSHSSSNNLKQFAQNLSIIQDYRDAEVLSLLTRDSCLPVSFAHNLGKQFGPKSGPRNLGA